MSTAVIALAVGFGAGYFIHSSPAPVQNTAGNFGGRSGMMRGGNGGSFLSGTVAARDSGSMTVNTRDGSSRVILITPATSVSKSISGSMSDVSVGSTIIVSGTTNSDGSVSASLIQIRPATAVGQ